MKKLLTGNEAIARGAYEAGVVFASAYPGTPSTEILENAASYSEISAEWAPNEKVAYEAALGAAMAGARSMASMKHVGVNVAADPLFTSSYTGVLGGFVLINADEPGQHSSQNEQDNRNYAKAAKIPMLEPANSQECKDFVVLGLELSEQFDTPVMIRTTTRVAHSKGAVDCGERQNIEIKTYEKNIQKYITVPALAKKMRVKVEERMSRLKEYAEATPLNRIEDNGSDTGVIASGMCYHYGREVFGDSVSYLKLGFTNPLPERMIATFCESVESIYILEENDPYLKDTVEKLGFGGKIAAKFPPYGEMLPEVIRKVVFGKGLDVIEYGTDSVVPRPPILCAGCPHRGFFYELGRMKNVIVSGDIGCYTLAFADPYNAMDCNICMGAGFSVGHGMQKVLKMAGSDKRVVGVMGDSTFFHTGVNSLIEVVYNNSNTVCVVLDNAITGMTGHQNNPGNGLNAKGEIAVQLSVEEVARACGMKNIRTINPNNLAEVKDTLKWALSLDEPSLIITRWPCALKRITSEEKQEFSNPFTTVYGVDIEKCIGCKACLKCGCPALSFDTSCKKANIDQRQCAGCGVCAQLCPKSAISEGGK